MEVRKTLSFLARTHLEKTMIRSGQCPKCGSSRVAGPHRIHGGDRHICIDLPGFTTATLEAFTCADCGYSEFYADKIGLDNIRANGRFVFSQPRTYHTPEARRCSHCGAEIPEGSTFCKECGYAVG
jgi:predicted nucleic-acid-binding Zn-ribbon protein